MKKFFSAFKIGLQVLKCLLCVHKFECPYTVVSTVVKFDKKEYYLTIKEIKKNDNK